MKRKQQTMKSKEHFPQKRMRLPLKKWRTSRRRVCESLQGRMGVWFLIFSPSPRNRQLWTRPRQGNLYSISNLNLIRESHHIRNTHSPLRLHFRFRKRFFLSLSLRYQRKRQIEFADCFVSRSTSSFEILAMTGSFLIFSLLNPLEKKIRRGEARQRACRVNHFAR